MYRKALFAIHVLIMCIVSSCSVTVNVYKEPKSNTSSVGVVSPINYYGTDPLIPSYDEKYLQPFIRSKIAPIRLSPIGGVWISNTDSTNRILSTAPIK